MTILHDSNLARELASLIDPCGFATVKRYFRDPSTEIDQVVLVQGKYPIEQVAAFFVAPSVENPQDALYELVQAGVIKYGVDDLRAVQPGFAEYVVLVDDIPDDQLCYVIYAPPAYIVRVTDQKWR